jgi:hypothetical protein
MTDDMVKEAVEDAGDKKHVIMDATILTTLMSCPRLADFRFNLQLQSIKGKSNSLECGSIVHTYLEIYNKCVIKGMDKKQAHGFAMTAADLYIRGCKECTDFTYNDVCPMSESQAHYWNIDLDSCEHCGARKKPKCGHKPNEYPGVHNTPADNEGYKTGWKWVLTTCEQYFEFYKNDHWVPLEVEVVKSKVLYEDDNMRILWKAKLDLTVDTNQGIFPMDHKTMKQRRPTSKLNNQFMGQCLIMGTRNVLIDKIGFQSTLKPEEKFQRSPISYSGEQLFEWASETLPYYALQLIEYSQNEYFPPNYSSCDGKYGQCLFHSVCESNPNMREEELRNNFVVGPEWNPTNEEGED